MSTKMMLATSKLAPTNPLDQAEELLLLRDIAYDASCEHELVAELPGHWCQHKLWYSWQEDVGVLVFSCSYDLRIPSAMRPRVLPLLAQVNEKLWLGHFDLIHEDGAVLFRYSMLSPEGEGISIDHLEAILDIALTECERFYPALQAVIWGNKPVDEALAMAMFDTAGEA